MQLPLRIDEQAGGSLQAQIFEQIQGLIADARLKPGMRLPASRVLATDLGVSRNTVVLAYEQLVSEGYLEMRPPVGTFVSRNLILDGPARDQPPAADHRDTAAKHRSRVVFQGDSHVVVPPYTEPVAYDFWVGRPDARLLPSRTWQQLINRKLQGIPDGMSGYGHPAGLWQLRQAVADYAGFARGIKADAEQVLIINGIQEGLNLLARLFIRRGTEVAVENPCYRGAAAAFTSYGARLQPVPVDEDGVAVTELPAEAAFVYVTPSHQYPTGVTLSPQRRAQLLEWAERIGAYVIEDDYDSDFYYTGAPLPALQSLDTQDQVIYLGTFSKSLAAGLRVGYMILPPPLADIATTAKALLNNCSSWLPQSLLAEFIASGAYTHHLRHIRTVYCARRNCLLDALGEHFGNLEISGAHGGMHLLWQLPADAPPAVDAERRCRRRGVGIYGMHSGNALALGEAAKARYRHTVLLGYAALNEHEITKGVRRLAGVLKPRRARPAAAAGNQSERP